MKAPLALLLLASSAHAWPVYRLHEWGTFTTVSGSDGVLLEGLEREEESLPDFVHAHYGLENGQLADPAETARIRRTHGTQGFAPIGLKGLGERPVAGVTVKMETPVIYFHSDQPEPFPVQVKVGFEGGTISQWYPQRSGGEILPEPPAPADPVKTPTPLAAWTLDFNKPYQGSIEWKVDVLPPAADPVLFKPGDNVGWMRARQPVTNAVRTAGGETEGYLFYRGIGRFNPGLRTTIDVSETLHLTNATGGAIPYALVFEQTGSGVRWAEYPDGIPAGSPISMPESGLKQLPPGFPTPIYQAMAAGLERCGLTRAESRSMVETWWNSYFQAPGLRVFWVLPATATDRILPLQVTPPPAATVRVIVGRSEVLRPRKEQQWLALSRIQPTEANANNFEWNYRVSADRFGLCIRKRVEVLAAQSPTAGTSPAADRP